MASMAEMLQTVMTQAELRRRSNPLVNNLSATLTGMEQGVKDKEERNKAELDRSYKLMQIAQMKQEMELAKAKQAEEIKRTSIEYRNGLFSNMGEQKAVAGPNGMAITTPTAKVNEIIDSHYDKSVEMDSKGQYSAKWTPKKSVAAKSVITTKKEMTKFEKGESIRQSVLKEQGDFQKTFQPIPPEKQKSWSAMLKMANELQEIPIPPDEWLDQPAPVASEPKKAGNIGKQFGFAWNTIKAVYHKLSPNHKETLKELKNRGAKPEEIKGWLERNGYYSEDDYNFRDKTNE
jgi:hypothetical protein